MPTHSTKTAFRLPLLHVPARRSLFVTEPLARNGLSLARNGFRFRGFHSGVNGPGLLLRSLAARLSRPFGFSAPPPESVSPNPRDFLASCPLRVHRPTYTAALPISTPLQEFFAPSGSKRSTGVAAVRFIFRIHPIFARSPPPLLLLVWASDHRPRFAMFSETCCSSNLLEPTSICSLTHLWSIEF